MSTQFQNSQGYRPMYFGSNAPAPTVALRPEPQMPNVPMHRLLEQRRNYWAELEKEKLEETRELDKAGERDDLEDEDLEIDWSHEPRRRGNISERLDFEHMKKKVDRGDRLSPEELDRLEARPSAQTKSLIDLNKKNIEPVGFTLSPMRALIRSL